jgi:hypothetical protein
VYPGLRRLVAPVMSGRNGNMICFCERYLALARRRCSCLVEIAIAASKLQPFYHPLGMVGATNGCN